jgi:hypothetical protein
MVNQNISQLRIQNAEISLKVSAEDSMLAHAAVGKKSISCLGLGTILTSEQNALAYAPPQPTEYCPKSCGESAFLEITTRDLAVHLLSIVRRRHFVCLMCRFMVSPIFHLIDL